MPYNTKKAYLGMSTIGQPRSNWWYALPILLSIVGGLTAYFALRGEDPPKAKNCLYVGLAMVALDVAIIIGIAAVVAVLA